MPLARCWMATRRLHWCGRLSVGARTALSWGAGFLSPYFITGPEKAEAVLEQPMILLYDGKISSARDLIPLLEVIARGRKSLLIVAEDVEADALATLVLNNIRGTLRCCAVKSPGYGDRRKALMGDMAALAGGRYRRRARGQA